MCTVSWFPRPDGYELLFNRDERITRPPEEPPAVRGDEGAQWIAPLDGLAGGTWISTNPHGLTLGLLNDYEAPDLPSAGQRSRGLLVRDLAASRSLAQVHARLEILDLSIYESFVLVGHAPAKEPTIFLWSGGALHVDSQGNGSMPLCSSGVDAARVRKRRRSLLELLQHSHGTLDREVLLAFHASHEEAPSAYSPCMHREDSETRSLCHVVVSRGSVSMAHAPGPPCRTALGEPVTLARA